MQSLTPDDNYKSVAARIYPDECDHFVIELDGTNPGSVLLPRDVKSARIVAPAKHLGTTYSAAVLFNASCKGEDGQENHGNLTGTPTHRLVHELQPGQSFDLAQFAEFNKIYADAAAAAVLLVYPGQGKPNELEA